MVVVAVAVVTVAQVDLATEVSVRMACSQVLMALWVGTVQTAAVVVAAAVALELAWVWMAAAVAVAAVAAPVEKEELVARAAAQASESSYIKQSQPSLKTTRSLPAMAVMEATAEPVVPAASGLPVVAVESVNVQPLVVDSHAGVMGTAAVVVAPVAKEEPVAEALVAHHLESSSQPTTLL